ncbi:MAG: ScyD/ScyE family protein [Candidatus Nanopelagicales bacterium]|nr:ScyD/ScyE family protein [Candidatus Nanopelagicales bacterium]
MPFTIPSAEVAAGLGLPSCTAGETYLFQPVPTDVERGRNGMLYVSSLPGGPEDASLGYRGGVYRVNPWTGHVKRIAWGLLGAVDLALDHRGRIYVAELFDNAITRVGHGPNRKVAGVPSPGAVEFAQGKLVVTSGNGFGDFGQPVASVVRVKP